MRSLRFLVLGIVNSALWPVCLGLAAYMARQSPLPRDIAMIAGSILALLALAWFAANLVGWILREGGPAEAILDVPHEVTKQLRWASFTLIAGSVVLLLPVWLLSQGLISSGGRPILALTTTRLLILIFEVGVLGVAFRLVRPRSAMIRWLRDSPERYWGLPRFRRPASIAALAGIASVIALDFCGYSFSARRLANGAVGTLITAAFCLFLHRLTCRAIARHAWRWMKTDTTDENAPPIDLAARLRLLSGYAVGILGIFLAAWIWDVDLALFRFIGNTDLWLADSVTKTWVKVGDVTKALFVVTLCVLAWRHMSTFFAVVVFPRMPDDPGVRFAVLTLCRYLVLGLGAIGGLSTIHLGIEKIGVVLAALGVGLGFGLQEIVSNFVCGIILLLERPIRVGDIVTVSNMTGKIDRINIRATTITNGDNQSLIVPNRAFITGDLVNWTLKDKILRVTVKVHVALGTDPDRVADLLCAIAREDDDILRNPVPSAAVEEFSESAMLFVLHAHVPDPSLAGRVKHRLIGQIQKRFKEADVMIALPIQELFLRSLDATVIQTLSRGSEYLRLDSDSATPPPPKLVSIPIHAPEPVEDCHRGVDE